MDLRSVLDTLDWRNSSARAIELAEKCASTAGEIREAIYPLPTDGFIALWFNKDEDSLLLNAGDWMEESVEEQWRNALQPLAETVDIEYELGPGQPDNKPGWIKIACRPAVARALLEKQSGRSTMPDVFPLRKLSAGIIPGAPNPLIGTLAGGLLGAGLGYGGGYLAEKILPEKWKRKRLRNTAAILGGLAGVAPGLMWTAARYRQGRSPLEIDPTPAAGSPQDLNSLSPSEMSERFGYPSVAPDNYKTHFLDKYGPLPKLGYYKEAMGSMTGYNQPWPEIDVPGFTSSLWHDERVSRKLTPQTRAAATGILEGSSALSGKSLVTPMDVAKLTAGMGSGYLSGAVIGKTLGLMSGMSPSAQERLKNTGLWAGVVANMVPLAFGR